MTPRCVVPSQTRHSIPSARPDVLHMTIFVVLSIVIFMGNFYQDIITHDDRFHSPLRCADVELLEPVTRAAVASIKLAAKVELGMDLEVFETFRSQARQYSLYLKKATQLPKVGTHGYGIAADFCKVINGQPSWAGDFTFLGRLAKRFGLIWGGDWGEVDRPHSFHDYDHVQRCSLEDQDKLFAGTWYPAPLLVS